MRFLSIMVCIAFALITNGCSPLGSAPAATPTDVYEGLIQLSGTGRDERRPLTIPAHLGNYTVYWSASESGLGSGAVCTMTGTIWTAEATPRFVHQFTQPASDASSKRFQGFRQSAAFPLAEGKYEVRVKSTCDWAILLGPERVK